MAGRVIIIGGGYIGAELARALDLQADVMLVEQRDRFCHTPVMIRALVRPELVEKALFPYDSLLRRGKVVQARAASVDGGGVTLDDGRRLEAEAIVVATGSRHGAAFKPINEDVEGLRAASRSLHDAVESAGSIAILGGGALGVELAGEIRAVRPQKRVTLISDTDLLPGYAPKLGKALARKLDTLGASLVLGQKAVDLPSLSEPFAGPVRLADGSEIEADLVIPALGARPETPLLDSLDGVRKSSDGRVLCDRWMRPSDLSNVFAAGDAADNGDPMTIVGTSRQVLWLTRAIRNHLAGRNLDRTPGYLPWSRPPILVPLGEHMGNSILPLVGFVGSGPTRLVKGRDLFLPKYRKLFRTG